MASNESTPDRHNDNSGAGTSDAPVDSNASTSKVTVRKDRACPFCQQSFTSSSLGRHLDFFIREKNPKPPDGIHDVDQIRKIRENITRRHTRIPSGTVVDNSTRRWSVTSIASPKSASRTHMTGPVPQKRPFSSSQNAEQKWPSTTKNWTATGVINNLPPRGPSTPLPRILPRPDAYKSQVQQQYGSVEEMDDARAAELALKEVLSVIKTAAADLNKSSLFEFDFHAYNFPALCLRVLSAPVALFSTTPVTNPGVWPLSLPDQSHFKAIQEQVDKRIGLLQREQDIVTPPQNDGQTPGRANSAHQFYQPEFKGYFDHLTSVFQQWHNLPDPQKLDFWHLELLRAYAQETEQKETLQSQLDALQTETHRLRTQLDDIRARQHATWQQMSTATSTTAATAATDGPAPSQQQPPLPQRVGRALLLATHGFDPRDWDYEKLIAKHRPTVQKVRRQSASHGVNDIRNAHERAVSSFGPSEAALLRPIGGQVASSPGTPADGEREREMEGGGGGGRGGRVQSEAGEDSQDGDGEGEEDEDLDVDMEDGPEGIGQGHMQGEESGSGRLFGRQGAG